MDTETRPAAEPQAPATKRAEDLAPGDVVQLGCNGDQLGEVRCVEPTVDRDHVVILLAGGQIMTSPPSDSWLLVTAEVADAYRAEWETARERTALASFITELGERVGDGLPLPCYGNLFVHYDVVDVAALKQAAEVWGLSTDDIETSGGQMKFYVRRGQHMAMFYTRLPKEEMASDA